MKRVTLIMLTSPPLLSPTLALPGKKENSTPELTLNNNIRISTIIVNTHNKTSTNNLNNITTKTNLINRLTTSYKQSLRRSKINKNNPKRNANVNIRIPILKNAATTTTTTTRTTSLAQIPK